MPEFTRQSLRAPLDAVAAAVHALHSSAEAMAEHGASRLANELQEFAVSVNAIHHVLQVEEGRLMYRAGSIPDAPAKAPAE